MRKKLLIILILILVCVSGCSIKKEKDLTDAEMFHKEYAVSKDNPFKYVTIDEILDILENGSGIILFGTSDSEVSAKTVKIFFEAMKETGHEKERIYYYDPIKIRDNQTKEYDELVSLLYDYLDYRDDEGEYLFLPAIYFVCDGNVVLDNNDAAYMKNDVDEKEMAAFEKNLKVRYMNLLKIYFKDKEDTNA
ncbi:MAG: hypothetical protein MR031_05525 [Tenericutes bacterium]|nr:hypothetical protein [Mycoplasmatota bacterium]